MGPTEPPSGDSDQVKKVRFCKEITKTLQTFDPDKLVHQKKDPVFLTRSFISYLNVLRRLSEPKLTGQ
jgi:hypothetical protein